MKISALSILSFCVFVGICNFRYFQNEITKRLPIVQNEHYFNVLIENKISIPSIQRKILGLPGVLNFEKINDELTKNSIGNLNDELDLTKEERLELGRMLTYKISMKPELNNSSIELIREYIVRLAGQENIMLGSIKKKINNEIAFENLLFILKKWPLHIALSVLFAFWLVSFITVKTEINRVAFIIENFQRKSNVAMKMLYTLLILNITVGLLFSYLILSPNLYTIVLFISIILLIPFSAMGKRKWIRA